MRIEFSIFAPPKRTYMIEHGARISWKVCGRRLWIFRVKIGYVNARDMGSAMQRASAKFPNEKRITVMPKKEDELYGTL